MANAEHLKIIKQGVNAWNQWRYENPGIRQPDLSSADLIRANLRGAIFSQANLNHANLSFANLENAQLDMAKLLGADLRGAFLVGATFYRANLCCANLIWADLRQAQFLRADMTRCILGQTWFGDSDLSSAKGLETIRHEARSEISISTIYLSQGRIPEVFLRGAGVPEPFITNMKSLVAAMAPYEFYSCFISYSSLDHELAERLHSDLQSKRVRCWFAPKDLKIGARLRSSFDEAIRLHDKVMVLLSEHSVRSAWVEKEVETGFEKERRQNKIVLFPIRLDDAVMETQQAWAADIRRTRHIGDFRHWKDHDSYKKAFERLLRDLKLEVKVKSPSQ